MDDAVVGCWFGEDGTYISVPRDITSGAALEG